MKTNLLRLVLTTVIFTLNSCSDASEVVETYSKVVVVTVIVLVNWKH
jgi:hypothetical protein